eukprot:1131810_1
MSKIKVIGTILLENVPQLICQALYAYAINDITKGVQLAFIASLLSVIAATLGYLIDKDTSDTHVVQYYLVTERNAKNSKTNNTSQALRVDERQDIMNNRGRTMFLGESIAEVFGIPPRNIEIGYSTITKHGLITHIVHYVDHDDLEEMQQELQKLSGDAHPQVISARYFTEKMHLSLQTDITEVMRGHFNLSDDLEEMQQELQKLSGDAHPQVISARYFTEKMHLSLQTDITEVMRGHFNLSDDFDVEYTNSATTVSQQLNLIREVIEVKSNGIGDIVEHVIDGDQQRQIELQEIE